MIFTTTTKRAGLTIPRMTQIFHKARALGGSGFSSTLLATGPAYSSHRVSIAWTEFGWVICVISFFPAYSQTVYKQFSDSANIYGGAETNNEYLGEIGTELWTSLGDGEVSEASISMNNKRMDESDVSASVVSLADYNPYFSRALDHLVSTSTDANAARNWRKMGMPRRRKKKLKKLHSQWLHEVSTI